jgi:glycosyltransferase involved in cell wall biosynthesis
MMTASDRDRKIAVLIPCYNEAQTIGKVVRDFRRALPLADIYVYDNNSTDKTQAVARQAGAIVSVETRQGKGNVVRRMFSDIEADIYLLVDGDGTYDASAAPAMISCLVANHLGMVAGRRIRQDSRAYRPGHVFGNAMLTRLVGLLFGNEVVDMLSGYRVFSRQFVKSFPALTTGFEIETELTVHALGLRVPMRELDTLYRERPEGSISKLATYKDGLRIITTVAKLLKNERPLLFFGTVFFVLEIAALVLSYPILLTYLETRLVPRFPTAILCTGMVLLGFICLTCGLVLATVTRGRWETRYLAWLAASGVVPRTSEAREEGHAGVITPLRRAAKAD